MKYCNYERGAAAERERIRLEMLGEAASLQDQQRANRTAGELLGYAGDVLRDFARRLESAPIEIPLSNGIAQVLAGGDAVRVCSCGPGYDPDCPFHVSR